MNKLQGLSNRKRLVIGFVLLLICLSLSACNRNENDIKQDLTCTLDAIKDGMLDEQSYIYSSTLNAADSDISDRSSEITEKVASFV